MTKKLLYLNGVAIVCVILFHAAGWGFTAMISWAHRYLPVASPDYSQVGSPVYYGLRLVEQLVVFSIPAFLFVSGFFVAFSTGKRPTLAWKTVLTRIKLLAIPYLLWSAAILAVNLTQGRSYTLGDLLSALFIGSTYPSYYFVPLLIQFYLISPLLVPLARNHWKLLLIVTGILQLGIHALVYPAVLGWSNPMAESAARIFPKWFFVVRLFWFSAGIVFGFHLSELKEVITRRRLLWVITTLALFVLGVFEWEYLGRLSGKPWLEMRETIVDALYAASFILMMISLPEARLPFSKAFNDLGAKSFGIYLIHSPVMEYYARGVYHFLPGLLASQALFAGSVAVVGLGLPLILMALVRRSALQRRYAYIFG